MKHSELNSKVQENYSLASKIWNYMSLSWILTRVTAIPYTGCSSKPVCSWLCLLWEEVSGFSLLSLDFISWMGGALTMVPSEKPLSKSLPFISLCSWHKAHQCMQQCTQHGSQGEFCSHQQNQWENLKRKTMFVFWGKHKTKMRQNYSNVNCVFGL